MKTFSYSELSHKNFRVVYDQQAATHGCAVDFLVTKPSVHNQIRFEAEVWDANDKAHGDGEKLPRCIAGCDQMIDDGVLETDKNT